MDDSEFDRTPNPFSAFAESRAQARRQLTATAKFLILVVGLFCLVTVGQVFLQRARLSEILHGLSQGSSQQKLDQLGELQASGLAGLSALVAALADEQPQVSEAAADMLLNANRHWISLPTEEAAERRATFVDALAGVSNQITDKTDPRWARVQFLARRVADGIIQGGRSDGGQTYQQLMAVIARDTQKASNAAPQRLAADQPLPLELVEDASASWTQWPPTSSRPTLYTRRVATIDSVPSEARVLLQMDPSEPTASGASLLKPRIRPAATLAEQSERQLERQLQSTQDWIMQLQSGSRLVRMQAVTELGKRGDPGALSALREHLNHEPDQEIIFRIEQRFAQQTPQR